MAEISLCLIVKNEEDNLPRCLKSIRDYVDEIIVVDTGSQDRTAQIAEELGANVYYFDWTDDFSAARNYSFSKATKEFIMWMDADDILPESEADVFLKEKEELTEQVDAVNMRYNTSFDKDGNVLFSYYRARIVRNHKGFLWCEPVHEYIVTTSNRINWQSSISHKKAHQVYSKRNIEIYESVMARGEKLSPRGLYYYARELKNHGRNIESIYFFEEFLSEKKGWTDDCIWACILLSELYEKIGKHDEKYNILYRSFEYDLPRGEVCCRLGQLFYADNNFSKAIFWYETAWNVKKPDTIGFIKHDSYDLSPAIWLSSLYDRIGDKEKALSYHRKAKSIRPDHPSVLHNDRYFSKNME